MLPAMSGRTAFTLESCSNARSTASFKNVPPCTMTFSPTSCGSRILMTLNSAFLMTEMAKPAAMSPTVAPSLLSLLHARVHEDGAAAAQVDRIGRLGSVRANSATSRFKPVAKLSMKLPQPDEHASLSMMWSITPSFTRRHFMS